MYMDGPPVYCWLYYTWPSACGPRPDNSTCIWRGRCRATVFRQSHYCNYLLNLYYYYSYSSFLRLVVHVFATGPVWPWRPFNSRILQIISFNAKRVQARVRGVTGNSLHLRIARTHDVGTYTVIIDFTSNISFMVWTCSTGFKILKSYHIWRPRIQGCNPYVHWFIFHIVSPRGFHNRYCDSYEVDIMKWYLAIFLHWE